MKAETSYFSKIIKGDHRKLYFCLKISKISRIFEIFQNFKQKYSFGWSPFWSPLFIFVKYDVSAFTGKKNHIKIIKIAFFKSNWILERERCGQNPFKLDGNLCNFFTPRRILTLFSTFCLTRFNFVVLKDISRSSVPFYQKP